MRLISQPIIKLTDEEKRTLRDAAEIVKEIIDALYSNKENGFSAFQEGLNAPECFWDIYRNCLRIDSDELIP